MAALETLAVIAYKQPVTVPEIQEIRGVHASGVIKTLLDKKFVATAGRKEVLGRPILYKTTRDFLVHFGLKDLAELPSMEEFEELIKNQAAAEELPKCSKLSYRWSKKESCKVDCLMTCRSDYKRSLPMPASLRAERPRR